MARPRRGRLGSVRRRVAPPTRLERPGRRTLDLFERELPVYWSQRLSHGGRFLVVNWEDAPREIPVDWSLAAPGAVAVRDFWTGAEEPCRGPAALAPHSCKLWEY